MPPSREAGHLERAVHDDEARYRVLPDTQQGVSDTLAGMASLAVRIGQPGGEESLNVAAAAAICLHASAVANTR